MFTKKRFRKVLRIFIYSVGIISDNLSHLIYLFLLNLESYVQKYLQFSYIMKQESFNKHI